MSSRRSFLKNTFTGIAAISVLPSATVFGATASGEIHEEKKLKLRFALASDGHYAQQGTDFKTDHENIVRWLNHEHETGHLDFVIINGDLVHNRPDLLKEVKENYFDRLKVPFYAIPGNHDHATTEQWKSVFGYEDNFSFEHGKDIAFVLANTSNTKGEYLCPDNKFLKKELDRYSSKKTVFIILHIPPHTWMPDQTFFAECPDTIELLHQYANIKAVFHGHDHTLDSVFHTGKLPHFFDAHFGGDWGTEYKGYRIVEVSTSDEISTYQVNASKNPVLNRNKI